MATIFCNTEIEAVFLEILTLDTKESTRGKRQQ